MLPSKKGRGSPSSACASHDSRQMLSRESGYGDTNEPRRAACGHVSITVSTVRNREAETAGRLNQLAARSGKVKSAGRGVLNVLSIALDHDPHRAGEPYCRSDIAIA